MAPGPTGQPGEDRQLSYESARVLTLTGQVLRSIVRRSPMPIRKRGGTMTRVHSPLARLLPALAAGVLLCAGCGEVYVRRMFTPPLTESWRSSSIACSELSPRSQQTLRRYDLFHLYPSSLPELSANLHAEALRDPRPELLFALSEVNYLRGRRAEYKESPDASVYYYLAAGYAYHYLFDEYPPGSGESLACAAAPSP